MTPLGQPPFFIDFLKTSGLFDPLVADCPLRYGSPNAPKKRDVVGTAMLAMLAGHKRYAHIAALRCDAVLPELLGMSKIVSEDAVRRAFKAVEENEGATWLLRHLAYCVEPPLYGHQEGAVLGYNPKKPGRPSHCYHTCSMASTRLVLDVDVCPGDQHASRHSAPSLWAPLDRLPRDLWPALLRGDCGFGNEGIMREAEARGLAFLFKLRLTANVKRMIEKLAGARAWVCAGQGFEAKESAVRLTGWSRSRRVIVLRRRVKGALGLSQIDDVGAPQLSFAEIGAATEIYEYSVLVTSLDEATEAFGQLYRDRGDGENIFDEMKNQWGWGGFTTHDLARCRLAARLMALFYDWWTIFVRLVDPSLHREAVTSRPLFLSAIATRTRHAAANDDPRDEFARQSQARRQGARGCSRLPAGLGQKCGAVDASAKMAGDPVARLPGVPQWPPAPGAAMARANLMQPERAKSRNPAASRPSTAVFRLKSPELDGRGRTGIAPCPPHRSRRAALSGSSAIAGFRPHRSHRAALPQWALQKGPEAGRSLLPCLMDHRFREGKGGQQLAVGRPGHAAFLAAFAERFAPLPDDAVLEHAH